jgi:hypothetical protein
MATPSKVSRPRADGSIEFKVTGRYADLISGRLPVSALDPEELARCQLKDKNGHFTGVPPKYLPETLVKAMRREFFRRGDKLFEDSYVAAVEQMVKIMKDPKVKPDVQLKAAQYVVERVRGKTPDILIVEGEQQPWQLVLTRITTADVPAIESTAVIEDAVIVDEERPLKPKRPRARRQAT